MTFDCCAIRNELSLPLMIDMDIHQSGNLIEAGVWLLVALVWLYKAVTSRAALRWVTLVLALTFVLFGLSDLIESETGAWWRPWWLLALKGVCVIGIVGGFAAYYRLARAARIGTGSDAVKEP